MLWNNFEADDECMEMVREVDAALQQGGLTYEKVLSVFNDDFSGKWCERVYNQDAEYKYIAPYTDKGLNYLSSLQGSRKAHREWWLSQRFSLLDAKWVTGDFRADVIQFLIPADGVKQYNFTIVAAQELYYGWGVNNVVKESNVHLLKGERVTPLQPTRHLLLVILCVFMRDLRLPVLIYMRWAMSLLTLMSMVLTVSAKELTLKSLLWAEKVCQIPL